MQASLYHRTLRVSMVLVAAVLVFDSGILAPSTEHLSQGTRQYIAAVVGISASVQPTEFNEITAALTAKEQELMAREAALREREIDARVGDESTADYSSYILSAVLFLLLTLIILNYTFDWIRARKETLSYANTA